MTDFYKVLDSFNQNMVRKREERDEAIEKMNEAIRVVGVVNPGLMDDVKQSSDLVWAMYNISKLVGGIIEAEADEPGIFDLDATVEAHLQRFLQTSITSLRTRIDPQTALEAIRLFQRNYAPPSSAWIRKKVTA